MEIRRAEEEVGRPGREEVVRLHLGREGLAKGQELVPRRFRKLKRVSGEIETEKNERRTKGGLTNSSSSTLLSRSIHFPLPPSLYRPIRPRRPSTPPSSGRADSVCESQSETARRSRIDPRERRETRSYERMMEVMRLRERWERAEEVMHLERMRGGDFSRARQGEEKG